MVQARDEKGKNRFLTSLCELYGILGQARSGHAAMGLRSTRSDVLAALGQRRLSRSALGPALTVTARKKRLWLLAANCRVPKVN